MYLNNVTLTGFVGGDAQTRNTKNNTTLATFSLATKESGKDRESGEWVSRTDWHRAVAFGRLADLARSFRKGDHIQVQGTLRTREYVQGESTKTVTEIHVRSLLKLDRSHKQNATQPEVA